MTSAILIACFVVLVGVSLGVIVSRKKSMKRKLMLWGLITMLIFTPFLGWIISILVGIAEGDGFAAVGMMMILFPAFFIIGLLLLLVGVFRKEAA